MMSNVGMLIGPDKATVATGDVFIIEHQEPLQLHVNSHSVLPASDQGVYTCHIPLQSGANRSINIGIYPSGFNSKYFLYNEFSVNTVHEVVISIRCNIVLCRVH